MGYCLRACSLTSFFNLSLAFTDCLFPTCYFLSLKLLALMQPTSCFNPSVQKDIVLPHIIIELNSLYFQQYSEVVIITKLKMQSKANWLPSIYNVITYSDMERSIVINCWQYNILLVFLLIC